MLLLIQYIFTLVVFSLHHLEVSGNDPEVKSPAGSFRGKILTSMRGGEYAAFRGIPYALPPIGERRFAKPEPYPQIKDVYDAIDFGPVCVQALHGQGDKGDKGQEDCLNLNVYTPLRDKETAKADIPLKKVFVFIHGGAYIMGSSNTYLPGDFVTMADVIVVTMNYRLGWLGFMRGNSDSVPGNQIFWDQLLALQWVKDNIRDFGGDPDDVTLAGESAGAISVSLLSITPQAKNLFTKGILMSGTATNLPTPSHLTNDMIRMAASDFGCEIDEDIEQTDEIIACFQKTAVEKLKANLNLNMIYTFVSSGDELLPRPLQELMNDSEYLSEVGFFSRSYLVSSTKDDGYIRLSSILSHINTTDTDLAVQGVAKHLKLPQKVVKLLVSEYSQSNENLERSLLALLTDAVYMSRKLHFVKAFRQNSEQRRPLDTNVYLVTFDHPAKYMPNSYMVHTLDLAYVFDIVPSEFIPVFYLLETVGDFTEDDWKMKSAFIDFIKVFMDTGTPGESLRRDLDSMEGQEPYISFSLHPYVGQDVLRKRRKIWDDMFPRWMKEFKDGEKITKEEL